METLGKHPSASPLITELDDAVRAGGVDRIVARVKDTLVRASRGKGLSLPAAFHQPRGECYARRLLHRSEELGYTVVVMTWGPAQGTPLHDHAGMWCVECVARGELDVTQYDLAESTGDRYRFDRQGKIRAVVGDAGCLIPPFEYHVLSNALDDDVTVTVHVYGGEMSHCHAYHPDGEGWWTRERRSLCYHD